MGSPKAQGTRWESEVVKRLMALPYFHAERLAEGGSKDRGDVRFEDMYEEEWYVECKATERLNVTRVLRRAMEKSGDRLRTVLAWKRLVKGGERRVPDGERVVVVMSWETFQYLIAHHHDD